MIRHFLPQPLKEAQHKWGIKLSLKHNLFAILFIVVPPSHSFFLLSIAASLSRQANSNQPFRSLADSQLCLIFLFNFFLFDWPWFSLSSNVHDDKMTCSILAVWVHQKIPTYRKKKKKQLKYYVSAFNFVLFLFVLKSITDISQCFILF